MSNEKNNASTKVIFRHTSKRLSENHTQIDIVGACPKLSKTLPWTKSL